MVNFTLFLTAIISLIGCSLSVCLCLVITLPLCTLLLLIITNHSPLSHLDDALPVLIAPLVLVWLPPHNGLAVVGTRL